MTTEVFGNFKNHDCDNCGTCKYSKKRGNKKPCKTCFGNSAYEPNDICCLTCKHGMMMNPSGAVCNIATSCHNYNRWEPVKKEERDALNIRNITLREVIDELEKERDELQQSLGMTDRLRKLHLKESKEIKEERMHIMGLYNNAKSERDSLKHQLYTVTKERDELQEIVDKADYYVPKMKKKVECSWRTFKYSKEVIKE